MHLKKIQEAWLPVFSWVWDLFLFNPVEIILIIQVFLDMVFGLKHIIVISMKCERRNVLCCMLSMWQLDWERGL